MKKKILSVFLAFILAFGFILPTLAQEATTPAASVQFSGKIGYGASLNIDTEIVVDENYYNGNATQYPALYLIENDIWTIVREYTADNCGISMYRNYDIGGNPLPWKASVLLLFTEAEYNAFDLTADYVVKIPAGAYKDEAGNPIGEKYVSFSGADIELFRFELTLFGQIHQYLWSFNETPLFRIFIRPLITVLDFIGDIFNLQIAKPLF